MGQLEDDIQHALEMALQPMTGARDLADGSQHITDPISQLVMPLLAAQREAIMRLAREIDAMRGDA